MAEDAGDPRIDQLEAAACLRWKAFPTGQRAALRRLLAEALVAADAAEPETVPVMNPTLRPQRLRLAVLASDRSLDRMYQQEWSELAAGANGQLYLLYRRRDQEDYAIRYDAGVTLPSNMSEILPEALAEALLGSDQ